jgi:hypothetical protein
MSLILSWSQKGKDASNSADPTKTMDLLYAFERFDDDTTIPSGVVLRILTAINKAPK